MPIKKVGSMYRWGTHGKKYKSRAKALRQGRAILASQARSRKKRR